MRPWTDVVAAKCAERQAHIDAYSQRLSDKDVHARISQIDSVGSLTNLYEQGQVSVEDVIELYIDR